MGAHINISLKSKGQAIMYYKNINNFRIGNPSKLVQNLNEDGSTSYLGISYSNINSNNIPEALKNEFEKFSKKISEEESEARVGWCSRDKQCRATYDMFFSGNDFIVQTDYSNNILK